MKTKIKNAIQRKLVELDRGDISIPVMEKLVSKANGMVVNHIRVESVIDDITSDVVNQYEDSIRTLEVTIEIHEDRVREWWNDFPNAALEDIAMEELQWSLPDTISVKEVTLPKDPLRQALENEVRGAIRWSLEDEI